MRTTLAAITFVLVGLLSGAPAHVSQTVLRAGLDVDAGTMDPRLAIDTSAARMQELIFSGLVRLDANLVPQPDLAVSWEFTSPTTLVFQLREGVTFHDGSPFTAADVVHTFTTLTDPDFGAPRRALYAPIESCRRWTTTRWSSRSPTRTRRCCSTSTWGSCPPPFATARRRLRRPADRHRPVPARRLGPRRHDPLAAFDDYHFGRPNVDEVVISVIPDNNVRLIAAEAGDLHLIHSPVPPQDLDRLRAAGDLVVESTTALGYTYLNLNLRNPVLEDVRVRQALAYLTDTETISEVIFEGMDSPGESFLLPNTYYYSDDVVHYEYDPERAMALLDEAGWTVGPGGVREKDGQRLSLELTTNIDPNRQQILEFLQGEWAQAGVEASVRVYEWPSFIGDVQNARYDVGLIGWLLLTDPDRATYLQFRSDGGNNYGAYSNPRVDELLDRGRAETDPDARRAIYEEIAQVVTEEAPYIFLLYQGYVVIHAPELQGFVVHPSGSWKSLESVTLGN
jgi:peptide/nickel transport system substrate-binding protein